MNNQAYRLIIWIVGGIVVSAAVASVVIFIGYSEAYATHPATQTIRLLGLPIYTLSQSGDSYSGTINMANMMFSGIIFAVAIAVVGEIVWRARHHRQNGVPRDHRIVA
jgi:hypothetical protein